MLVRGSSTVMLVGGASLLSLTMLLAAESGTDARAGTVVAPAEAKARSAAAAVPNPRPSPAATPAVTAWAMSPGWNLGNTLEAIGSGTTPKTTSQETAWGNPAASQANMNAIKAAGFRSVRIPVSWSQYADAGNNIPAFWLSRVGQVVTYARNAGLYAIINVHWDGGWLQPTYAAQPAANARLAKFWNQIGTYFKTYDDHLLFAGTNEVMVTNVYTAPTAENCAVQKGFNQLFVNTVRATGGNNANRTLVVQAYNTNIDYAVSCNATMPTDSASRKLMMEVHFYDPYNFTLNTGNAIWQWGAIATNAANTETWANEAYVDAQFQKMKTAFVDKGVPVILGEYAASLRTEYDAPQKYRNYWDQYITHSAFTHGMVPMYWDAGTLANHGSGLFNRATGAQGYSNTISQIVAAAQ